MLERERESQRLGLVFNDLESRLAVSALEMLYGKLWCQPCGCLTNHDSAMHEAAERNQGRDEP